MSQFPKSKGALFLNAQKAGEKHPDLRGHLLITAEQIQMLVKMGQSGGKVQLQVAGWQRVSQAGAAYIYLEGEAYIKIADQSQPQGYAQPQAAPQMMPQQPMQQQVPQQQVPVQYAQPVQQQVPVQHQVPQQAPTAPEQPPVQNYTNQPAPEPQLGDDGFVDDDIPF